MDVYTAGKKIEALEQEVGNLRGDLNDLRKSVDRIVDEANASFARLKGELAALKPADAV